MNDSFDDFDFDNEDDHDEYGEDFDHEEFSALTEENSDESENIEPYFAYDLDPVELAVVLGISEELAEERRREALFRRRSKPASSETRRNGESGTAESRFRKFENQKPIANTGSSSSETPVPETTEKKNKISEATENDFSVLDLLTFISMIILIIFLLRACS